MNGRKLLVSLLTFSSLMLCASSVSPQNKTQSQKPAEVPLATDQHIEAPGWWPTKTTVSRQDFVGTEQCARCHAKRTNSQLATPMAQASMPASASGILRDSDMITLKLDSYAYAIARNSTASIYSVSDSSNAISETLLWAFGVGNKGQTYIYLRNGSYYELRRLSSWPGRKTRRTHGRGGTRAGKQGHFQSQRLKPGCSCGFLRRLPPHFERRL